MQYNESSPHKSHERHVTSTHTYSLRHDLMIFTPLGDIFGCGKNKIILLFKIDSGRSSSMQILSRMSSTGGSKFCIMTIDLFFN
jgi:hypothetical protein